MIAPFLEIDRDGAPKKFAESVKALVFWALLASGQISMRKIDGWHTLATKLIDQPIDLAV